jgi:hypothetical protein
MQRYGICSLTLMVMMHRCDALNLTKGSKMAFFTYMQSIADTQICFIEIDAKSADYSCSGKKSV